MAPSVEIAGCGPDLVLLHGWGLSSSVWQPVRERLAAHYTLHLVDLPGHGRSRGVSLASLAELVAAIARLVPAKAMLCGWSLGGLVAQSIAATQPVRRLVLVSSTPSFLARDGWPDGMQPGTLADFAGDLARDWRVTLARFLRLNALGGSRSREALRSLTAALDERGDPAPEALARGLDLLRDTDLRDKVAAIGAPTLVIHGTRDMLAPVAAGRWLAARLPSAKLVEFDDAAHLPFLTHADAFADALIAHGRD
jgi:pimeloyl-[acyl-carrier protein] methyl ester esterase